MEIIKQTSKKNYENRIFGNNLEPSSKNKYKFFERNDAFGKIVKYLISEESNTNCITIHQVSRVYFFQYLCPAYAITG